MPESRSLTIDESPVVWEILESSIEPHELAERWPVAPGFALLESTLARTDSWSILAAFPSRSVYNRLPDWQPKLAAQSSPDEPPFATGWIGYLSYESATMWNPALTTRASLSGIPDSFWARYDASLAYRHADGTWRLGYRKHARSLRAAERMRATFAAVAGTVSVDKSRSVEKPAADEWTEESARLENSARSEWTERSVNSERSEWTEMPQSSERPGMSEGPDTSESSETENPLSSFVTLGITEPAYRSAIEQVLNWIGQGHIYQANYTYPIEAEFAGSPVVLYKHLRRANPAPYGAFLHVGNELNILSSSPEQFLAIAGDRIQTRPIKGTEARSPDPETDRELAAALEASEKDRAELTMIVDLERNDLGRLCRYGTVRTHPFPVVESFETVHHLVATVEGRLRSDVKLRDILAATFPGGSVTGAPKVRAMEILAEMETRPRFIYTGALGYFDDRGTSELALTIRTLWTDGQKVHFDVGGGIVADSTPESEWEETHQKASGMTRAISRRDREASHRS